MPRNFFAILLPAVGVWTFFSGCSKETASVAAIEGTIPASDYLAEGNEEFKKYFGDVCEVIFTHGSFSRSDFESNFDRATKWVQEAKHPQLTPYKFAHTLADMRRRIQKYKLEYDPARSRGNPRSDFKHDLIGVSVYLIIVRLAATAESEPIRDRLLLAARSLADTFSLNGFGWRGLNGEVVNVSTICKASVETVGDKSLDCLSTVFKARQWLLLSHFLAYASKQSPGTTGREAATQFFDTDALWINEHGIRLSAEASKEFLNCLRILANELDTVDPESAGKMAAKSEFEKSRVAVLAESNPQSADNSQSLSVTS